MRNSLAILADRGIVQPGTVIELVPSICSSVAPGGTGDRFRAVVVKPQGGSGSIRWAVDGQCYSAAALLAKLEKEDGVCSISIVYRNWRIVGHEESIWGEADSLGVESDDEVQVDLPPPPPPPSPPKTPPLAPDGSGRTELKQSWLRENVGSGCHRCVDRRRTCVVGVEISSWPRMLHVCRTNCCSRPATRTRRFGV